MKHYHPAMNAKHYSLILSVLLCSFTASAQFFIEPNIGVQMNSTETRENHVHSSLAGQSADMSYGLNFGRSLTSSLDLRMSLYYSTITRSLQFYAPIFAVPDKLRRSNFLIGAEGDYYVTKWIGISVGIGITIHARYQDGFTPSLDENKTNYTSTKEGNTRSKSLQFGLVGKLSHNLRLRISYSIVSEATDYMALDLNQNNYINLRLGYALSL